MATGTDARVVRTKAKLVSVFKKLLCDKSFEDITVNEICEAADVRRATFYKHYADKYAFLAYFVESLRCEFDSGFDFSEPGENSVEYYAEYVKTIVEFLEKNDQIVKNTLKSEVLPSILNVIMMKNYELTLKKLDGEGEEKLIASAETVASMMTGAISGAIINWLKQEKRIPREILIDEISSIIPAILGERK